jgi:hypothetical protein
MQVFLARWLSDGKRIVVTAKRADDKWRLYLVSVDGGEPTPLSDGPVIEFYLEVSRDDRFAAATTVDGTLTVYPFDGSPRSAPGIGALHCSVWMDVQRSALDVRQPQGVSRRPKSPAALRRSRRSVIEGRTFSPADVAGLEGLGRIRITPDGRTVVYEYVRNLTYLYELKGLTAPRP